MELIAELDVKPVATAKHDGHDLRLLRLVRFTIRRHVTTLRDGRCAFVQLS
jgi:hypothetical protein